MTAMARRVVVGCFDPRIMEEMYNRAREGVPAGKVTFILPPGGSININARWPDLEMAICDLGADELWSFAHEDCLGCKKTYGEDRKDYHLKHLRGLETKVRKTFVTITQIRLFYMSRISDEEWVVEEVNSTVLLTA